MRRMVSNKDKWFLSPDVCNESTEWNGCRIRKLHSYHNDQLSRGKTLYFPPHSIVYKRVLETIIQLNYLEQDFIFFSLFFLRFCFPG